MMSATVKVTFCLRSQYSKHSITCKALLASRNG